MGKLRVATVVAVAIIVWASTVGQLGARQSQAQIQWQHWKVVDGIDTTSGKSVIAAALDGIQAQGYTPWYINSRIESQTDDKGSVLKVYLVWDVVAYKGATSTIAPPVNQPPQPDNGGSAASLPTCASSVGAPQPGWVKVGNDWVPPDHPKAATGSCKA